MELLRNGRPRVVVTGLGAVTALGDARTMWESLKAGKSGIRRIETIETEHVPVKIAGEVRGFDPDEYVDRKEARRMGRASHFAVAAAKMATEDAGITPESLKPEAERVGVVIGTSLGSHEMSADNITKYRTNGFRRPNPTALINSLPNMLSHYVSRFWGAVGPLRTPSAACASGTQAIGEGFDLIRYGRSDVVIAGGIEAILQDYTLAGFEAMNALATEYNDDPASASRPFDANRSGFVLSEGGGIVVLESLAHALKRGAHIYGEVLGYGVSSDAFHFAAIDPQGAGAARAMRWALEDARLNPDEIHYINAHGTSTKANDFTETLAIKTVFGEHAYKMPISSTKSMLGHALGGAGTIEAIACLFTIIEQVLHPTINYETPDPECDLDYVPNVAREVRGVRNVLSNSFGLGGQNASIVLGAV